MTRQPTSPRAGASRPRTPNDTHAPAAPRTARARTLLPGLALVLLATLPGCANYRFRNPRDPVASLGERRFASADNLPRGAARLMQNPRANPNAGAKSGGGLLGLGRGFGRAAATADLNARIRDAAPAARANRVPVSVSRYYPGLADQPGAAEPADAPRPNPTVLAARERLADSPDWVRERIARRERDAAVQTASNSNSNSNPNPAEERFAVTRLNSGPALDFVPEARNRLILAAAAARAAGTDLDAQTQPFPGTTPPARPGILASVENDPQPPRERDAHFLMTSATLELDLPDPDQSNDAEPEPEPAPPRVLLQPDPDAEPIAVEPLRDWGLPSPPRPRR